MGSNFSEQSLQITFRPAG